MAQKNKLLEQQAWTALPPILPTDAFVVSLEDDKLAQTNADRISANVLEHAPGDPDNGDGDNAIVHDN